MDFWSTVFERIRINLEQLPYLLSIALGLQMWPFPPSALVQDHGRYDFIVVGAGSAGAIVAHRLSEVPNWQVLLVEAGGDPPFISVVPGLLDSLSGTEFDWAYRSMEDPKVSQGQDNRTLPLTRGKMLGGSSSINYMFYTRGNPADYDGWAKAGFRGWDWENVLPYFKKSEAFEDKKLLKDPTYVPYHNTEGLIKVSKPHLESVHQSKVNSFLEAMNEIGVETLLDYNGPEQIGIGETYFTHSDVRSSTAEGFIRRFGSRKNLHVLKRAFASKILIDSKARAVGVEVKVDNKTLKLYANKEVIASAGAYNTPKLLHASGIGSKDDLAKLNVSLILDLPVGHDMQDHLYVPLLLKGRKDKRTTFPSNIYNSIPYPVITGFLHPNETGEPAIYLVPMYTDEAWPLFFESCKIPSNYRDDICQEWANINADREVFLTYIILLHPQSRGRVKITDLDKDPEIYQQFFSQPGDKATVIEAIRFVQKLNETTYFKDSGLIGDLKLKECRNMAYDSDEYWSCYCDVMAASLWHPAGTCAMGQVVDERLKVFGVQGLRVVDASVIPSMPSGSLNAPVMMIGERASDLIKEDHKCDFHSSQFGSIWDFLGSIFGNQVANVNIVCDTKATQSSE